MSRTAAKAKAALAELERSESGKPEPPPQDTDADAARQARRRAAEGRGGIRRPRRTSPTLARGLAARGGDWPAKVQGVVTQKLGDGTPAGVRSSYGLFLLGQLAIDRNRCADVARARDRGRRREGRRPRALAPRAALPRRRLPAERQQAGRGGARLRGAGARVPRRAARAGSGVPTASAPSTWRARRTDRGAAGAAFEEALTTYLDALSQGGRRRRGALDARATSTAAEGDCAKAAAELGKVPAGAVRRHARASARSSAARARSPTRPPPKSACSAGEGPARLRRRHAGQGRRRAAGGPGGAHGRPRRGEHHAAGPRDHRGAARRASSRSTRGAQDLFPRVVELGSTARVALGAARRRASATSTPTSPRRPTGSREDAREPRPRDSPIARAQGDPERDRAQAVALAQKVYAVLVARGRRRPRPHPARRPRAGRGRRRRAPQAVRRGAGKDTTLRRGAARRRAGRRRRGRHGTARSATGGSVVESSAPGGTAWYEARIEQVTLLAGDGRRDDACNLLRSSRGRSTTAGGDALAARLRAMEPEVCR